MFSVIIPIHNAEKTLRRCLDSLLDQSHGDFEALLIENGSTDKSFDICKEYTGKDKRFRAFSIGKCSGPSKPRNIGLKNAKGECIAFLDADDWYGTSVLSMLKDCLEYSGSDVVFWGFSMMAEDGVSEDIHFPKISTLNNKEKCIQLQEQDCFGYICCKAYRRRVLNEVFFDEKFNLFEDEVFGLKAIEKADSVYVVPEKYNRSECLYHSIETNSSLMHITHENIVQLKEFEYHAWKSFLAGEHNNYLSEMANKAVSYCRYYIFERKLALAKTYRELTEAEFYQDALVNPSKVTEIVSRGYKSFKKDWIKWKIKTALR